MAKLSRPRYGSLQFWPRKRAERAVPRVNWNVVKGNGLLGVIGYKVGMATAFVKDKTEKSMTLNKKIALPVTLLEIPKFKIYSVRFYNKGNLMKEVVVSRDPILKRKVRLPKKDTSSIENVTGWDELRAIVYPIFKNSFKKTPDLAEIKIESPTPLETVKGLLNRELSLKDATSLELVDTRGLTTGKGLVGPVKRFGVSFKSHKSEKGVRRPGSLGPWHPAHVTFRVPMAGQLGMFTRVHYNLKVVGTGAVGQWGIVPTTGFKRYGTLHSDFIVVAGSVQGPPKRVILLTPALRPTKKQLKRKYDLMELKL